MGPRQTAYHLQSVSARRVVPEGFWNGCNGSGVFDRCADQPVLKPTFNTGLLRSHHSATRAVGHKPIRATAAFARSFRQGMSNPGLPFLVRTARAAPGQYWISADAESALEDSVVVLFVLISNGQDEDARRARNFLEHDVARGPEGDDQLAPRLALANLPEAARRHSHLGPDRRLDCGDRSSARRRLRKVQGLGHQRANAANQSGR